MEVLALLANRYNSLTRSEQKVADFIKKHPTEVITMAIQTLAKNCNTSDATILRCCRSLGFSGYQDFKSALIPELLKKGEPIHKGINTKSNGSNFLKDYTDKLFDNIHKTIVNLEPGVLEKIVTKMVEVDNIIIVGLAGSAGVGQILANSLLSLKKNAYHLSDRVEIERIIPLLSSDDMLIALSHSGETEEVCYAAERAKEQKVFTIGVTNCAPSKLYSIVDEVLLTSVFENLLGSYSCIPRIAQLAILELLIILFSEQKNY